MWFKWRGKPHPQHNQCELCGFVPFTPYMVKNELWPKEHRFLCLNCLCKKIGRMITTDDFIPCQWTNHILLGVALAKGEKIDLTGF